jgi:hypothetical protein
MVKRELIALAVKRYDAQCFIDGGILSTTTEALAWGATVSTLSDRIIDKSFQHYKIRDPFTGKTIPVTITFLYALLLPNHILGFGAQTPFVGERSLLVGNVKNTLLPLVDADDLDIKEELYKLRLNYYQTVGEHRYVRGTQSTAQAATSDLSEVNNMLVLLEIKREIEDLISTLEYNFAEPEDRQRFTDAADRAISKYRGLKVREAIVDFRMSQYEEDRQILHCYLSVVFKTMAKRSIVEIDVNRRV